MTAFRDYIPGFLAPAWLLRPKGRALLQAFGSVLDEGLTRARDGVKARFATTAPSDALGDIAFERGLPRGPGESAAAWALRLKQAFEVWSWAGSPYGVLRAMYTAGYKPQLVIGQGLEYELDTSTGLTESTNNWGGPFDFTGRGTAFWSTVVLYFPTSRWPASWTTAGAPPAQTSDEARMLLALARRWMAAFATFARVVVQGTCPVCGIPPKTCGSGLVCGGTGWSYDPPPPSKSLP